MPTKKTPTRRRSPKGIRPARPKGAVVLTPEVFERVTRKWVMLPGLSKRVRGMSTNEMLTDGLLQAVEEWPPERREEVRAALVRTRLLATFEPKPVPAEIPADAAETVREDLVEQYEAAVEAWEARLDAAVAEAVGEAQYTDAELLEGAAAQMRENGVWVEIGPVGFAEAASVQPDWPDLPKDEHEPDVYKGAFDAWFDALPQDRQQAFTDAIVNSQFRFVAMGLVTPRLSANQVKRFKDDAVVLAMAIMHISGLDGAIPVGASG